MDAKDERRSHRGDTIGGVGDRCCCDLWHLRAWGYDRFVHKRHFLTKLDLQTWITYNITTYTGRKLEIFKKRASSRVFEVIWWLENSTWHVLMVPTVKAPYLHHYRLRISTSNNSWEVLDALLFRHEIKDVRGDTALDEKDGDHLLPWQACHI